MSAWLARLLPAVFVLGLAAPVSAAEPPTVKDDGNLFSELAKKEANGIIADIEKRFKKDVRVEAYNKPPADRADEFEKNRRDLAFRRRFFKEWADRRMQETGTNGLLLLIFQDAGMYFA